MGDMIHVDDANVERVFLSSVQPALCVLR